MDDSYASDSGQGSGGGIFWKVIAVLILIGFMVLGIKFMYDKRKEEEQEEEEDGDEDPENEKVTKKKK